jgi:hypothetical protein
MRWDGKWGRSFVQGLLGLGLAALTGCLGFLHPCAPPKAEIAQPCLALPKCCRGHVYVFLMNGLDPMNYGNLTGLRDYLQALGFCKTYYGQLYHVWWFEKEIRRLHQEDPDSHFVLIGFSLGCNMVHDIAVAMKADGISIDLLVFLSGNHPVAPMPHERPDNVGKVVNLLASGVMATRGQRDWADNIRLTSTWHFGSPTHPTTLDLLTQELAVITQSVPVAEPLEMGKPKIDDVAPTPRPITARGSGAKAGWDFLKPTAQLGKPPTLD